MSVYLKFNFTLLTAELKYLAFNIGVDTAIQLSSGNAKKNNLIMHVINIETDKYLP